MKVEICALLLFALCLCSAHGRQAITLKGSFNADATQVTVSGISAGAAMAVQFAVAHSSLVRGSGTFAGVPFYCAEGTLTQAIYVCMAAPATVNLTKIYQDVQGFGSTIDPVSNIASQKHYIYAGTADTTVNPAASHQLESFWLHYTTADKILTKYDIPSAHAQITDNYGNACNTSTTPFINNCGYDAAGALLQHFANATLTPRTAMIDQNLMTFNQTPYGAPSFQDTGFVYVPTSCKQGKKCSVHVAFHGCNMQSTSPAGEQYVSSGGYNTWAEANGIIVLYPQAAPSTSPYNPQACFDWWGYSGATYSQKSGPQIVAIRAMIDDILSPQTPTTAPTAAPSGVPALLPSLSFLLAVVLFAAVASL